MLWQTHTWALPYACFFIPPHRQYTSLDSKCSCCIEVWDIICYWESSAISVRDLAKYKLQAESVLCSWMLPQSLQSKSERGESKYERESGRFQCPRALSERRAGPLPIHTYLFHSNVLTWAAHTNIFQATRNANKRLQRSHSSLPLSWNRGLKCTKTNMKHRDFHIWICEYPPPPPNINFCLSFFSFKFWKT